MGFVLLAAVLLVALTDQVAGDLSDGDGHEPFTRAAEMHFHRVEAVVQLEPVESVSPGPCRHLVERAVVVHRGHQQNLGGVFGGHAISPRDSLCRLWTTARPDMCRSVARFAAGARGRMPSSSMR